MKTFKKPKGITLIALIITIILLLVLSAIIINSISENGIIKKTKEAKETFEQAQDKEKIELIFQEYLLQIDEDNLENYIEEKFGEEVVIAKENDNIEIALKNSHNKYSIDKNRNITYIGKIITFSINGIEYIANKNDTFGNWILNNGGGSSGNSILWVSPITGLKDISNKSEFQPGGVWYNYRDDSQGKLYMETRAHTSGLPTEKLVKANNIDTEITVNDMIEDNGDYGGYYYFVETVCCFDAGTQILMADGTTKNIEEVKVGDKVKSYNEETKEFVNQIVERTIIKHNSNDLVYVNLSDGTTIGMRAYHPLLTTEGYKSLRPELAQTVTDVGYKVELLKPGDILVGYKENVTIISIEQRDYIENYDTYNLTINGTHNYIANGIVVHNASCPT